MFSSHRKNILFLLILTTILYLVALGSHGLLDPDEGRYSEIPREMIESGDYITPRLNYVAYFEKPVLHYWLTALSFKVMGQNEFAGRFWPAIMALGGVFVTYWLANRMNGARSAFLSAWILATSLVYFAIGQINITDMPLSFFMTLSLAGFWMGHRRDRRFFLLFYAGMALATLTKGLIGIVLPAGVTFWWIVLTRKWSVIKDTLYLPGIALFFLIGTPWFVLVCLENPDFFNFFFIQEHFLRYTTKMHGRFEPWWWFIPILLVGLIPWTGFIPGAVKKAFPSTLSKPTHQERGNLFLLLWFAIIFAFFSLSSSKLIPYIIPVIPPLAILAGNFLDGLMDRGKTRELFMGMLFNTMVLLPFGIALAAYPFLDQRYGTMLLPFVAPVAAVLIFLVILSWIFYARGESRKVVLTLCIFAFLNIATFKNVFGFYDRIMTARDVAATIREYILPGDIVAQYREYDQGLPFYLKQRIVLVEWVGELEFGSKRGDQSDWFLDTQGFLERYWKSDERVILVMREEQPLEFLEETGVTPVILFRSDRKIVVANKEMSSADEK
ncbi:MAG TPA: glycosyltransferase family 39 protein [Synergistales bacterium]|nr:glycosyltransferase family 39 protein [Synergistales bacterium]HRV71540.1 glycosyltransferase family 39 protein [Thermovirgaceae bacterium]